MKKIALFAMAAITFAACSNEDDVLNTGMTESQLADNAVVFVPEVSGGTRNAITPDLVNEWKVGDKVGTSVVCTAKSITKENGLFTGVTYTTAIGRTLTAFTYTSGPEVDWVDATSSHDFYLYYPYVEGATHTAVPVTLNSVQTEAVPNQFLWAASKKIQKPADKAVPFAEKRLLPVAEFNIIRDDASLDGYTLDNIVVKPTDGSTMETGTTNVDLETLGDDATTNVSFSGTPATQYQLNYAVAVNDITKNGSASVYMSLPPAASKEYTVTATFSNGTDRRAISVKRTDAFTIAYGKGNFVRYYFKSSKSTNPDTPKNYKPVFTIEDYFAWDAYLYYGSAPSETWGPTTSRYHEGPYMNINSATASCKDCATSLEMQMYLAAGVMYDSGAEGPNQQTYKLPDNQTYHAGYWLKKKAYIPGLDDLSAPMNNGEEIVVQATTGRPDNSVIDQYFFVPFTGLYRDGVFKARSSSSAPLTMMAWSRTCVSMSASSTAQPGPTMINMGGPFSSYSSCEVSKNVTPWYGLVRFYAE